MALPFALGDIPLLHPSHYMSESGLWVGVMWSVIYLEGFDAQRDGELRVVNPYARFGEESCKVWEAGWDQAEREKPTGVYGQD